jgi:uncharacterized SAM-binding protein YcdF (DUF218 family)
MWRWGVAVMVLCLGVWVALAVALDRYGHRTIDGDGWDAIVVAGCRVDPDGTPSLALKRRTRRAVALWKEGVAPRIVFTGGIGTWPPSEASAAASWAESLGVPRSALVLEERSTSTEENARFAAELLGADARIVVVTDSYHVFRAERVFGRFFAEVRGSGSEPSWDVRTKGGLREVLAVAAYGATGRL